MRYFITKNMLVGLIAVLAAALVMVLLNGCVSTSDTRSGHSQTIIEHVPTTNGGYVEKRTTYEESEGQSKTQADIDWGGVITKSAAAVATGDWAALGGVAATTVAAGGLAFLKHREAQAQKRDADDAWERLLASKDKSDG